MNHPNICLHYDYLVRTSKKKIQYVNVVTIVNSMTRTLKHLKCHVGYAEEIALLLKQYPILYFTATY